MTLYLGDQEVLFNNIKDNSIDAIITDPPYNLRWKHKMDQSFNFQQFVDNSYRVLKDNGFLVYFGQEPTMSERNVLAQEKLYYLAEVIWFKQRPSSFFQKPYRVHEKIIIFTKGSGKLNSPEIEWEKEKQELIDYIDKTTFLKRISEIKKMIKEHATMEELQQTIEDLKTKKHNTVPKRNDNIYEKYSNSYVACRSILLPKKLTTLWGCSSHNRQCYNKEEFNIKHPTVKPIQIMERLIEMTTQENQIVLDVFMGSGTTGVACHNMNRQFIGFELLEEYYQIAQNRITGLQKG